MVTMFGILNINARGVAAAQAGISTTGQNIANANTEGYSRQRVIQRASSPLQTPQGVFGHGVEIISVERIRDAFLDSQIRGVQSDTSYNQELDQLFLQVEAAISDPLAPVNDTEDQSKLGGINNLLSKFFRSLNDLSVTPDASETRTAVVESGISLAETFNFTAIQLSEMHNELNERTQLFVDSINSKLREIAELNVRISVIESSPTAHANDQRDQRDMALKELSKLIPISTIEAPNGMVNVTLAGQRIVDLSRSTPLVTEKTEAKNGAENISIRIGETGLYINDDLIRGGRLGATLDMRDRILPFLQDDIDMLARGVMNEINKIHSGASGLRGKEVFTGTYRFPESVSRPDTTFTLESIFNTPQNRTDIPENSKPFPVQDGELSIRIADVNGNTRDNYTIDINTEDSVYDVVERIDRSDGIVKTGRSALTFDPVYVTRVKAPLGALPAEINAPIATLDALDGTPMAENAAANQTLELHIKDQAGNLVDANPNTPAIEPFVIQFNGNMTMQDLATAIQQGSNGLIRASLVPSDTNQNVTVLQLGAIRNGYTFSVQNDTSGMMRGFEFPITDPNTPLIGGSTTTAATEFAGPPNASILGGGNPAFSPAFPGPPPSVISAGTFELVVVDNNNVPTVTTITLAANGVDTIDELAAAIEAADPNLTVQITPENDFIITSDNKRSFFFQNDTTGLVKAMGFDQIHGFGDLSGEPFIDGTFEIVVSDQAGTVSHIIEVPIQADPSSVGGVVSLNDIIRSINNAAGSVGAPVQASIVTDPKNKNQNVLQVEALGTNEFTFRSDDSFILAALGFIDGPVLAGTSNPPILAAESTVARGDNIGGLVRASLNNNGTLQINTTAGNEITFTNDTSHLLSAMGVNTFFDGNNATNMRVKQDLVDNKNLLATSRDGSSGNNEAALEMAELESRRVLNGQTFSERYRATIATLGIEGGRTKQFFDTNNTILRELETLQEQEAGVSLDEESINLIKYQQAFQASARVISTVDQLLDIIVNQIGA